MKGKILKGFCKAIASLMVTALLFTGNGIPALAASTDNHAAFTEVSDDVIENEISSENGIASEEDAGSENQVLLTSEEPSGDALQTTLNDSEAEEIAEDETILLATEGVDGGVDYKIDDNGNMTIEVTGDRAGTKFVWNSWDQSERDKIKTVKITGSGITNLSYLFYQFKYLESVDLSGLNTKDVTNMSAMFNQCIRLKSVKFKSDSNTSFTTENVKNMKSMFNTCQNLESLDLSTFNTSSVTNMANMFKDCSKLSSITFSDNFNTGSCTEIQGMFDGCKALTSLDLHTFNLGVIEYYSNVFNNCSSLTSINAPLNVKVDIALPSSHTWYYDGAPQTILPKNLATSMLVTTTPSSDVTVELTVTSNTEGCTITICDSEKNPYTATDNKVQVPAGKPIIIKVVPATGYEFVRLESVPEGFNIELNDGDVPKEISGSTIYFKPTVNVSKEYTINAVFQQATTNTYNITGLKDATTNNAVTVKVTNKATGDEYTINDGKVSSIPDKTQVLISITPNSGYEFESIKCDSAEETAAAGSAKEYTITKTIDGKDIALEIKTKQSETPSTSKLKINQPTDGKISVSKDGQTYADGLTSYGLATGQKVYIKVTPNSGKKIKKVILNDGTNDTEKTLTDDQKLNGYSLELTLDKDYTISAEMEDNNVATYTIDGLASSANYQVKAVSETTGAEFTISNEGKIVGLTDASKVKITVTPVTANGVYLQKITTKAGSGTATTVAGSENAENAVTFTVTINAGDVTVAITAAKKEMITVSVVQPLNGTIEAYSADTSAVNGTLTAEKGTEITVMVTAKTGYQIAGVTHGTEAKTIGETENKTFSYTFTLNDNVTISAEMKELKYQIQVTQPENGTIYVNGKIPTDGIYEIQEGAKAVVTVSANDGSYITSIKDNNTADNYTDKPKTKEITYASMDKNHTITAVMALNPYTITVNKPDGISTITVNDTPLPSNGIINVSHGQNVLLYLAAAEGKKITQIKLSGAKTDVNDYNLNAFYYTVANVKGDITVDITVADGEGEKIPSTYAVTVVQPENGTIVSTDRDMVNNVVNVDVVFSSVTFKITANKGKVIKDVLADGKSVLEDCTGNVYEMTYTLSNISKDQKFTAVMEDEPILKRTVTLKVSGEGTAVIENVQLTDSKAEVEEGTEITIVVTPKDGYEIKSFTVGSKDMGAVLKATVTITEDTVIDIVFAKKLKDITLDLDGFGKVNFTLNQNGKLTTSQNLIPSDAQKPFIGAIFMGWFTEKDGKGLQVIDESGNINIDAFRELTSGDALYIGWKRITVVERQKVNIYDYFMQELAEFQNRDVKNKKKYKFVVYTEDSLDGKYIKGSKNKLGTVAKTGIFTAKKAGHAKIYLETYDAATKTYVRGNTCVEIVIEKLSIKKFNLCYIGETATPDDFFQWGYSDIVGYQPKSGDFDDLKVSYSSSKLSVIDINPVTGNIRAIGFGTAKIKVTYELTYANGKKPYKVTKTVSVSVKAPKFSASKVTLTAGKQKLNTLRYTRAKDTISWSVDNTAAASVDQDGRVTALSKGEANVKANVTYADGTKEEFSYFLKVK